ncbi:glycerol-3-phosphate transporter [Allorhodopirellula solitaria]|uniref:Glycerol-3-phosphate transporter n=1 Tax=Allorhodopirellula solitaria TaxID=2527987 RepID=A0A5C5XV13_9BACT|nr:glycerol-3-phosphate transporter [Allorhodopirellula solitaria]TWT67156.1 Glycerol-3-phosphate transporter [Allorhodopirellula solitaria]
MISLLRPPSHRPECPVDAVDSEYRRLRIQVFVGIFVGYAGYYLVRKNFALAMPDLIDAGFSKTQLGFALSGVSIAYGLSKFLMGAVSDRSNARVFMSLGLACSAMTMIVMGLVPAATTSVAVMFLLLLLNGWFQGMGWPPCGRVMVHWFSHRERGIWMSFWNVAHNIGGGLVGPIAILAMAIFGDWHAKLYFPGFIALAIALWVMLTVRDTPQSQGLPSIEAYKDDYPTSYQYDESHEQEFTTRQIFFEHVLNNRLLWVIAVTNAFVYLVRYGVLDWAPTYLSEEKGFSFSESGWAYAAYEWAGIPGTIACGYLSDKVFKGRRAPAVIIYMVATTACVITYWLNPPGNTWLDIAMLIAIGFLIYGPVMLIGVFALDLVPKKAAGTAAGFTGLFGYLGGSLSANILIGYVVDRGGWDAGFILIVAACVLSIVLTAMTVRVEARHVS